MIKVLAIAVMLSGQGASPPAAPLCLTRQQIGDVALVASSIMMDAVREACRPHLAANAFLIRPAGADYLTRLRTEADRRFGSATRLMALFFGGEALPAEEIRSRVGAMVGAAEGGFGTFDAPLCREIDEITEAMSPMSPDQGARFSTAFYSLIQQLEARAAAARAAAAAVATEGDAAASEPSPPGAPAMPAMPPICPE